MEERGGRHLATIVSHSCLFVCASSIQYMCATTTTAVAAVYLCRFFSRIRIRCLSQYYLCIGKQYRGDGRERTQKWTQKAAEKKTYNHTREHCENPRTRGSATFAYGEE